jgi:hypothetical protein
MRTDLDHLIRRLSSSAATVAVPIGEVLGLGAALQKLVAVLSPSAASAVVSRLSSVPMTPTDLQQLRLTQSLVANSNLSTFDAPAGWGMTLETTPFGLLEAWRPVSVPEMFAPAVPDAPAESFSGVAVLPSPNTTYSVESDLRRTESVDAPSIPARSVPETFISTKAPSGVYQNDAYGFDDSAWVDDAGIPMNPTPGKLYRGTTAGAYDVDAQGNLHIPPAMDAMWEDHFPGTGKGTSVTGDREQAREYAITRWVQNYRAGWGDNVGDAYYEGDAVLDRFDESMQLRFPVCLEIDRSAFDKAVAGLKVMKGQEARDLVSEGELRVVADSDIVIPSGQWKVYGFQAPPNPTRFDGVFGDARIQDFLDVNVKSGTLGW